MNNPLFIPLFRTFNVCVPLSMSHTLHDESYSWHTKRKYTSRLMMASGSVFQKRGRLRFWEASLLSASYTSRFIRRLETRERETEKKREHFLEFTITLNDMMREEISENEGMIHLILLIVFIKYFITHSFFFN